MWPILFQETSIYNKVWLRINADVDGYIFSFESIL